MTLAVNLAQGGSNNVTFRNKIINGAMVIDQRNAGASYSATNGGFSLDRWGTVSFTGGATTGKYTVQQNAGSVTPPVGFTNYLGVTSTAATSTSATDIYNIRQWIEGYNIADLGWGTANAKTVTVSFWVRSSATGTFGGVLQNNSIDYCYPFTYTISSANTWEQKSVTITGPTSGTWLTTNGAGLALLFQLQVGTNYTNTAGSWYSASLYGASGCVNLLNNNGATFYITGVQLEAGTTASPFEYRQYGTELALCQRYYCKSFNQSVAPASNAGQAGGFVVPAPADTATDRAYLFSWRFPVSMRTSATVTTFNPSAAGSGWFMSSGSSVAASVANAGTEGVMIVNGAAASANQNAVIQLTASAEL